MLKNLAPVNSAEYAIGVRGLVETTMSFNELLLEAIDAALSSLGESPKKVIYFFLEEKFNIQKHEIPYKLEDFASSLEEIFKDGAKCLEKLFLDNLYAKTGGTVNQTVLPLVYQELPFQGCVELIRRNFESETV